MELLELRDKTLQIFNSNIDNLGSALMKCAIEHDIALYDRFCELVDGDLSVDWMQKIYQYYHADRKDKKQDYTPKCLAQFMSVLAGEADVIIDLCAGSGALTIQRWQENKEQKFELFEIDENVIPYLLFNLAVRNIRASINRGDALNGEIYEQWESIKGDKYAKIVSIKPTL